MMRKCGRCESTERKTIFIYKPQGMSFMSADFNVATPPQTDSFCGECLTDNEIERLLGPVVAFVLGVVIKQQVEAKLYDLLPALETVRSMYMVRNNDSGRSAAIRALGLDGKAEEA